MSEKDSQTQGEGMNSQYAELCAVYQAIKHEQGGQWCIFTDRWSAANGLIVWMPHWKKTTDGQLPERKCGKHPLWGDILQWDKMPKSPLFV